MSVMPRWLARAVTGHGRRWPVPQAPTGHGIRWPVPQEM